MKNYVINLERAVERREAIIKEFDHYGIEFEFASGIDWLDLTEQDFLENVDPKYLLNSKKSVDSNLPGVLACWLSHRNLWEFALAENFRGGVAIFEDDAKLTNNTKLALAAIEKLGKSGFDFDIIFLFNGRESKPMVPAYCIDETFRLNLIKYNSMGAVGYVITSRAMKTMLDEYPLLAMGIDELMHWYWVTGLKTYIITPQVVFHDFDNHSYSGECLDDHLINIWKNENPIKFAKYKIKRRIQRTQRIPSRIFLQSIPKRLEFRKRMKIEVL